MGLHILRWRPSETWWFATAVQILIHYFILQADVFMGFSITSAVFGGIIIIMYSTRIARVSCCMYCDYCHYHFPRPKYSYDTKMGLTAVILTLGIIEFGTGIWVSICLCVMNSCCTELEVSLLVTKIQSATKTNGSQLATNLKQLLCCYSCMWWKVWLVWLIFSCGLNFFFSPYPPPFFAWWKAANSHFMPYKRWMPWLLYHFI